MLVGHAFKGFCSMGLRNIVVALGGIGGLGGLGARRR